MSDLPQSIVITEEGLREGFKIEKGPVSTRNKIALINALSLCGFTKIQATSFVNIKHVPGWADAEAVIDGMTLQPNVAYTALWFNESGFNRALAFKDRLALSGSISLTASDAFTRKNLNRDRQGQIEEQRSLAKIHTAAGIATTRISIMASFGCNYSGDVAPQTVVEAVADGMMIAKDNGLAIKRIALADSMGWATPKRVSAAVDAVRSRWPDQEISLHLHDTRGLGIACAYEGLRLGVRHFDAAVAGLGGCPFAGQPGALGNIATEELVLLADEMGIATGIDNEALLEASRLAEAIIGRQLPSALLRSGTLENLRKVRLS
jgi:isopropylmalate/homocitrate/citramalate synthase